MCVCVCVFLCFQLTVKKANKEDANLVGLTTLESFEEHDIPMLKPQADSPLSVLEHGVNATRQARSL